MATSRFNGAGKWLLGVAALLAAGAVSAGAVHVADGKIHESPEQKSHRIRTIVREEVAPLFREHDVRMNRIEDKIDRLLLERGIK